MCKFLNFSVLLTLSKQARYFWSSCNIYTVYAQEWVEWSCPHVVFAVFQNLANATEEEEALGSYVCLSGR